MNKEVKKAWLDALRSGKYEQARSTLNNGSGGFCCLGVLCDISKLGHWNKRHEYVVDGLAQSVLLTTCGVKEVAELTEQEARQLASMNDRGYTFKRIADYIEKHL